MSTSLIMEFGRDFIERINNARKWMQAGLPVILVDDEDRENEGDIIFAAEKITPQSMNFMIKHCSGIICLCLPESHISKLGLEMMVPDSANSCKNKTAFTVSIDGKAGVTTGVSAADRTITVMTAIADSAKPEDLAKPGHIFPLRAREGGTLERTGHTEGSIDLAKISGLKPAAVLCELMNEDGTMSRLQDIILFARKHQLTVTTINDIISYRNYFKL